MKRSENIGVVAKFFDELGTCENSTIDFCEEHEVRILDINKENVVQKLISIGAECICEETLQKRIIMDFPNQALRNDNAWVRLRSFGQERIELTIKQRGDGVDFEKTVLISDFEKTRLRLENFGLVVNLYQENKRMTFVKDKIIFDIDTWPLINTFLEIEAPTKKLVTSGVYMLGFKNFDISLLAGEKLFSHYGIDLNSIKELKFDL